jgi:TRAP-type mannitol/chloroaromatic compound transport system permease small subunit
LLIWPARALLLAGFVLLVLQAVSEIIKKVAVIRGLIEDPHPTISAKEAAELEVAALVKEIQK